MLSPGFFCDSFRVFGALACLDKMTLFHLNFFSFRGKGFGIKFLGARDFFLQVPGSLVLTNKMQYSAIFLNEKNLVT